MGSVHGGETCRGGALQVCGYLFQHYASLQSTENILFISVMTRRFIKASFKTNNSFLKDKSLTIKVLHLEHVV